MCLPTTRSLVATTLAGIPDVVDRIYVWLSKIARSIERQSGELPAALSAERYLEELQSIALGRDPTATAHDRLIALRELLKREPEAKSGGAVTVHMTVLNNDDRTTQIVTTDGEDEPRETPAADSQ